MAFHRYPSQEFAIDWRGSSHNGHQFRDFQCKYPQAITYISLSFSIPRSRITRMSGNLVKCSGKLCTLGRQSDQLAQPMSETCVKRKRGNGDRFSVRSEVILETSLTNEHFSDMLPEVLTASDGRVDSLKCHQLCQMQSSLKLFQAFECRQFSSSTMIVSFMNS